jgi:hypothetical protein
VAVRAATKALTVRRPEPDRCAGRRVSGNRSDVSDLGRCNSIDSAAARFCEQMRRTGKYPPHLPLQFTLLLTPCVSDALQIP